MGLEIERAEGVWLYDSSGKAYLDFISGISVSNTGHRDPRILQAIQEQTSRHLYLMVYGEFIQSPQLKLAEALAALLPGFDSFYLVNSGTEATEGAIKLARRFTGRKKLISFFQSYHGSSTGALSLMGEPYYTEAFEPLLPGVEHFKSGDSAILDAIDEQTAAVFCELLRAEVGAELPSLSYLKAIEKRCKETGTLLVVDEIQTGFGRTGPLFLHQELGIQPDILLLAKSLGGGLPLGAFAAPGELMQCLSADPVLGHITTFGGHPLSCAAALANLEILKTIDTRSRAAQLEARVRERMVHPLIRSISGKGLLLALDCGTEALTRSIIKNAVKNGLITDWFLFAPHKIRICPPLSISFEEFEDGLDRLWKAIEETAN